MTPEEQNKYQGQYQFVTAASSLRSNRQQAAQNENLKELNAKADATLKAQELQAQIELNKQRQAKQEREWMDELHMVRTEVDQLLTQFNSGEVRVSPAGRYIELKDSGVFDTTNYGALDWKTYASESLNNFQTLESYIRQSFPGEIEAIEEEERRRVAYEQEQERIRLAEQERAAQKQLERDQFKSKGSKAWKRFAILYAIALILMIVLTSAEVGFFWSFLPLIIAVIISIKLFSLAMPKNSGYEALPNESEKSGRFFITKIADWWTGYEYGTETQDNKKKYQNRGIILVYLWIGFIFVIAMSVVLILTATGVWK